MQFGIVMLAFDSSDRSQNMYNASWCLEYALVLVGMAFLRVAGGLLRNRNYAYRQCCVSSDSIMVLLGISMIARIVTQVSYLDVITEAIFGGMATVLEAIAGFVLCIFVIYATLLEHKEQDLRQLRVVVALILLTAIIGVLYKELSISLPLKYIFIIIRTALLIISFALNTWLMCKKCRREC